MLRQERSAWLSLFILGLAIAAFGVLSFILGAHRASGAFGLLGLLGLVPVFNRPGRLSRRDNAPFDERDAMIQANSVRIAYAMFWVVFVGASIGLWALYQGRGVLPVEILPLFPMVGWMVVTLVQSIAILVQYARGR